MGLMQKLKGYFQVNTIVKIQEQQDYKSFSASGYNAISTISRCIDLIVNTAASFDYNIVKDAGRIDVPSTHKQFEKLLQNPDPEFGKFDFWRSVYSDMLFSGNAFLYNLGDTFQKLDYVDYNPKPYFGQRELEIDRLTHIRLMPETGNRYGATYFSRIETELELINKMLAFSYNYFKNNGLPGLILESDNPLSQKQKERIIEEFVNYYSIARGNNSKPFISDNSLKVKEIQHSLRDLQFQEGIDSISSRICAGLGVPSVLLDSGNNANLSNNYKMFVFNTVYPLVLNVQDALTKHLRSFYNNTSNLKVVADLDSLPYLQDDLLKRTNSIKTLVTSGICTVNEARSMLKMSPSTDKNADTLLFPANITGSHFDASPGTSTED